MKAYFGVTGIKGKYWPRLTIGVQTFSFGRECETKKEANWYIEMMEKALHNLNKDIPEPEERDADSERDQPQYLNGNLIHL